MNKPNNFNIKFRIKSQKADFVKALKNKSGNISSACEAVSIGRTTFYDWCKKDQKFLAEVEAASEALIDFAESKLIEKINDGNITAITFFLKTKGRRRGYDEKQEFTTTHSDETTMKINRLASEKSDARLNKLIEEYSKYDYNLVKVFNQLSNAD